MPRIHRLQVDAPEDLRASDFARWLQRAAVDASTAAGFSDAWYAAAGSVWVVRRTTLEIGPVVRPGERLEISTWVADFRRVRSRREYEIRRVKDGEPAAAAHTDWVYLDRGTGKLRRVPDEMIAGFVPEGGAPALPREAARAPEPPATAFGVERVVAPEDIDELGHVNNAVYFDYVEETLHASIVARDVTTARNGRPRARLHDVEYLEEAMPGERLRCLSWAGIEAGERFGAVLRASDKTCLSRSRSRWEWVGGDGRPMPMPPSF